MHLPQELSLFHGTVLSVYSKTEKAAAAESGVCRVFDRAPAAASQREVVVGKSRLYSHYNKHN